MALVFPNTAGNYKAFFKEFAKSHKNIKHDDNPNRQNFCVVSINTAITGFSNDDVRSFLNKERTRTKASQTENESNCQMILIQMTTDANEGQFKNNQFTVFGSFAILTKPKSKNTHDVDLATEICYDAGSDILAGVKKFFELNYLKGKIISVESEAIRVNDSNGWRFDLTFLCYSTLCYDSTKFNNLNIVEI